MREYLKFPLDRIWENVNFLLPLMKEELAMGKGWEVEGENPQSEISRSILRRVRN